mgnify:CR=1 FL=1
MRIEVSANGVVVGWSDFEGGDPPLGVAWGVFHTVPPGLLVEWSAATLQLCMGDGQIIDTSESARLLVEDHRQDLADEAAIEVRVLGLPAEIYGQLFPNHVAAYLERFNG